MRQIELTYVGFRAHVKIASRIVSYRIVCETSQLVTSMIVNNVIATGNATQQSTMLYKQNAAAQHAVGLCFLLFKFTFVRRQLLNVNDFSVLVRQEACYSVLFNNLHNAAITRSHGSARVL